MSILIKSFVVAAAMSVLLPASAIQLVTKEEMIRSQKAPPVLDAAAAPADPLAANANSIDPDVARLKWLQAIDASQERALPGATRTANNDALAFVDA